MGFQRGAALRFLFHRGYVYSHFILPEGSPVTGNPSSPTPTERWNAEWKPYIMSHLVRLEDISLTGIPDDELGRLLQEIIELCGYAWDVHHRLTYPEVEAFYNWCRINIAGVTNEELHELFLGQDFLSLRQARGFWKLAHIASSLTEGCVEEDSDWATQPQFLAELSQFVSKHGLYLTTYCDIGRPSWEEDPSAIVAIVKRYMAANLPDPSLRIEQQILKRQERCQVLSAALPIDKRPEFDRLYLSAFSSLHLREDHVEWIEQRPLALLRRVCKAFGIRLHALGLIEDPLDCAYFTLTELYQFACGISIAQALRELPARKSSYESDLKFKPPRFIREAPRSSPDDVSKLLKGMGISRGTVSGRVCSVRSVGEAFEKLSWGDILVCPEIGNDWTPLFSIAGGLVIESFAGGMLSHAALVAREYRIPAILGIKSACSLLDGRYVDLDGTTGLVEIGRRFESM